MDSSEEIEPLSFRRRRRRSTTKMASPTRVPTATKTIEAITLELRRLSAERLDDEELPSSMPATWSSAEDGLVVELSLRGVDGLGVKAAATALGLTVESLSVEGVAVGASIVVVRTCASVGAAVNETERTVGDDVGIDATMVGAALGAADALLISIDIEKSNMDMEPSNRPTR